MKWENREESENVEDRRGLGKTGMAVGGVGGLVILIVALFLGVNPQRLAQLVGGGGAPGGGAVAPADPAEERMRKFSSVVFRDTEVVWDEQFREMGKRYEKPKLVLFRDQVDSACGRADAAVGPFYCPGDRNVYIDLSFFREMERKLNAPGEFARAYVIAHEVGHHVQNLLGYSRRVDRARGIMSKVQANRMSVRLELQADYLAGVWAYHAQKRFQFLEPGDVDSALNAAFQIGDDTLQKRARGRVVPDSFQHGSSEQRVRWFKRGLEKGDVKKAAELFSRDYDDL